MSSKFAKWSQKVIDKYGDSCLLCSRELGPVHHFYSRSQYPDLAWEVENGVQLCQDCHTKIEHGNKNHNQKYYKKKVIKRRGFEWYEKLRTSLPEYKRPPRGFYKENGKIKEV